MSTDHNHSLNHKHSGKKHSNHNHQNHSQNHLHQNHPSNHNHQIHQNHPLSTNNNHPQNHPQNHHQNHHYQQQRQHYKLRKESDRNLVSHGHGHGHGPHTPNKPYSNESFNNHPHPHTPQTPHSHHLHQPPPQSLSFSIKKPFLKKRSGLFRFYKCLPNIHPTPKPPPATSRNNPSTPILSHPYPLPTFPSTTSRSLPSPSSKHNHNQNQSYQHPPHDNPSQRSIHFNPNIDLGDLNLFTNKSKGSRLQQLQQQSNESGGLNSSSRRTLYPYGIHSADPYSNHAHQGIEIPANPNGTEKYSDDAPIIPSCCNLHLDTAFEQGDAHHQGQAQPHPHPQPLSLSNSNPTSSLQSTKTKNKEKRRSPISNSNAVKSKSKRHKDKIKTLIKETATEVTRKSIDNEFHSNATFDIEPQENCQEHCQRQGQGQRYTPSSSHSSTQSSRSRRRVKGSKNFDLNANDLHQQNHAHPSTNTNLDLDHLLLMESSDESSASEEPTPIKAKHCYQPEGVGGRVSGGGALHQNHNQSKMSTQIDHLQHQLQGIQNKISVLEKNGLALAHDTEELGLFKKKGEESPDGGWNRRTNKGKGEGLSTIDESESKSTILQTLKFPKSKSRNNNNRKSTSDGDEKPEQEGRSLNQNQNQLQGQGRSFTCKPMESFGSLDLELEDIHCLAQKLEMVEEEVHIKSQRWCENQIKMADQVHTLFKELDVLKNQVKGQLHQVQNLAENLDKEFQTIRSESLSTKQALEERIRILEQNIPSRSSSQSQSLAQSQSQGQRSASLSKHSIASTEERTTSKVDNKASTPTPLSQEITPVSTGTSKGHIQGQGQGQSVELNDMSADHHVNHKEEKLQEGGANEVSDEVNGGEKIHEAEELALKEGKEEGQAKEQANEGLPLTPININGASQIVSSRKTLLNGDIETIYTNGTREVISADKCQVRHLYRNGDVRTVVTDGTVTYFYAESSTWQTTFPNGIELFKFPNGLMERRLPHGLIEQTDIEGRVTFFQSHSLPTSSNQTPSQLSAPPQHQQQPIPNPPSLPLPLQALSHPHPQPININHSNTNPLTYHVSQHENHVLSHTQSHSLAQNPLRYAHAHDSNARTNHTQNNINSHAQRTLLAHGHPRQQFFPVSNVIEVLHPHPQPSHSQPPAPPYLQMQPPREERKLRSKSSGNEGDRYRDRDLMGVGVGVTDTLKLGPGERIVVFENGEEEIHGPDYRKRIFGDGTVKTVYNDGSQETRYPNGRIRIKDGDGNLVADVTLPTKSQTPNQNQHQHQCGDRNNKDQERERCQRSKFDNSPLRLPPVTQPQLTQSQGQGQQHHQHSLTISRIIHSHGHSHGHT